MANGIAIDSATQKISWANNPEQHAHWIATADAFRIKCLYITIYIISYPIRGMRDREHVRDRVRARERISLCDCAMRLLTEGECLCCCCCCRCRCRCCYYYYIYLSHIISYILREYIYPCTLSLYMLLGSMAHCHMDKSIYIYVWYYINMCILYI